MALSVSFETLRYPISSVILTLNALDIVLLQASVRGDTRCALHLELTFNTEFRHRGEYYKHVRRSALQKCGSIHIFYSARLSVILVCRLTLNLREFAVEEDPSVPQFSSVKEAPSMTFGSSDTPPDFHDGAEGDYERSNNDQGGQLLRDEIHPLDTENP